MTDYFDFFNQRIGKMMQRQAETFAAVTAAPCKNFSSTPLDSATIDGSDYDTQTSTNVQGGVVPANLYSCNHWTIDSTIADTLNRANGWRPSPPAKAGDKYAYIVWEIPYTRCNSSTATKTYMSQILIFTEQPDGSFTRNNSTATAYEPVLLGTLDSYYPAATLNAANTAIKNVGDPWAIRINTSQLNTMINANINAISTWVGTFPVAKYYDDCFMLSTQPPRWTPVPNSVAWTSEPAELATAGGGRPLKVTIAWEVYAVPNQAPTEGRYIARSNHSAPATVVIGTTSSITPDSAGNFDKSQLADELSELEIDARNYLALEDRALNKEEEEFVENNTSCPSGFQYKGDGGLGCVRFGEYKSYSGGSVIVEGRGEEKCFRCLCKKGYVTNNYDADIDAYISTENDGCREYDCPENAYYSASQDQCVCKGGYTTDANGDCVETNYSISDNNNNGDNNGDDNGDDLKNDGDDNGEDDFDLDAHLKEYGVWYGFGFAGLLAMSLIRPKRG